MYTCTSHFLHKEMKGFFFLFLKTWTNKDKVAPLPEICFMYTCTTVFFCTEKLKLEWSFLFSKHLIDVFLKELFLFNFECVTVTDLPHQPQRLFFSGWWDMLKLLPLSYVGIVFKIRFFKYYVHLRAMCNDTWNRLTGLTDKNTCFLSIKFRFRGGNPEICTSQCISKKCARPF